MFFHGGENSMLIPVLMLFLLGLGVPIFSISLGFAKQTSGVGWIAIMLVSVVAIMGAVVIYVVARLQRRPEE
jgi:cytochrome c biogenesis protein CcdA